MHDAPAFSTSLSSRFRSSLFLTCLCCLAHRSTCQPSVPQTSRICLLSASLQALPVPPDSHLPCQTTSTCLCPYWLSSTSWDDEPLPDGRSNSLLRRSCVVSSERASLLRLPNICQSKPIKLSTWAACGFISWAWQTERLITNQGEVFPFVRSSRAGVQMLAFLDSILDCRVTKR